MDTNNLILGIVGLVLGGSAFGGIAGLIVAVTRNKSERRILEQKADAEDESGRRRSALDDMQKVVDLYQKELDRVHKSYQLDLDRVRAELQEVQRKLDRIQAEHGTCERRCAGMEAKIESMTLLLDQHGIRSDFIVGP